jgi:SWI/SNF-related matrix-associated actin-dependent regulator 1 of chromatin subfamily A
MLRDFQIKGVEFLASKDRAYLADDMGLGKSYQVVAAADKIRATRILVICPASLKLNWQNEFMKWAKIRRNLHVVSKAADAIPAHAEVLIVNYEALLNDSLFNRLMTMTFDLLVCDEAHRLKTHTASRTRRVLGPRQDGALGVASRCRRAWLLSGTPAPNDASELYTACKFADEFRGNFWTFRQTFCVCIQTSYGSKIVGHRNVNTLKGMLKKFTLRRTAEEVLKDLPPITYSDIKLTPKSGKQLRDNDIAWRKIIEQYDANIANMDAEELSELFSRAAADLAPLRHMIGTVKAPEIVSLVTGELEDGLPKIIIFAWHRVVIETLKAGLAKYRPVVIDGSTPMVERQTAVDRFQTDPETRVFIGNILAAGEGLTLTASNQVLFAEQSWVPKDNLQAAKRAHRIGQTRPVMVRFCSFPGTIDDVITKAVSRKTALLTNLMELT